MEIQIDVNGKQISAVEGETLLTVLRKHGFKIPTMCHMNRFSPTGACRLCVVEVEGKRDLITSCSYPVEQGMKVRTNSQRVMRARKSLVELLLSNHPDDCLYCVRNGHCELQWLAEEMNVKERKYFGEKNATYPDYSSTSVARDPAKCVLCSRCVRICEEVQLVTAIDFISRGNQTKVNSAFNQGLNVSSCIHCGQCIQVCPTAALTDISHVEKVQAALGNPRQKVVFLINPGASASMAVELKWKPGENLGGRLAAALRSCGAFRVFDMGYATDLHIVEEARLLATHIRAGKPGPMLSSCCPAWVRYVEEFRSDLLDNLAPVKSSQQFLGTLVKTVYAHENKLDADTIFTVGVTPCVANKYEASREENTHRGISEVDAVLTVRELFHLLRAYGLEMKQIDEELMDEPFATSSAFAYKVNYTGGKAEAVARELFRIWADSDKETFKFNLPKNQAIKRETRVKIGEREFGFAWVSSIEEADSYLREIAEEGRDDIHYIEVMACLGGCAGGGGQPISRGFEKPLARKRICQDVEKGHSAKSAWEHADIRAYYNKNKTGRPAGQADEWLEARFRERTDLK